MDMIARLRDLADCDARAGEPLGKCMREAADRIAKLESALGAIVAEADRNPFNPVGTVIEHVVPEARDALSGRVG